jgi:NTE family protein
MNPYLVPGVAALALAMMGCASTPMQTARNTPLCEDGTVATHIQLPAPSFEQKRECTEPGQAMSGGAAMPAQSVPRARAEFSPADPDVPDVFVGLAISGGGSRAALFGMSVMKELDELGILQHVTAISTTSGGGLAGAYYALNAENIDWQQAQDKMADDYLGKWLRLNARPRSIWRLTTSDEDRSDLMASVFSQELFPDKTYSDLGPFKPGAAPIWLANTTMMGDNTRFTFTTKSFDELNSDLATMPIAHSVMASAAFPAVFNAVTLREYQPKFFNGDQQGTSGGIAYKHLIDGGPTDNLGIEALLTLARSHALSTVGPLGNTDPTARQGKCLIMIVDAHPRGVPSRYDERSDTRGVSGRLLDTNFLDALDALLAARRADLLGYLGLADSDGYGRRNTPQVVFFDSPLYSSRIGPPRLGQVTRVGTKRIDPLEYDQTDALEIADRHKVQEQTFRCAAWHINLGGLQAIANYRADPADGALVPDRQRDHELDDQRLGLQRLVSQVDTNFRLAGPEGCPAQLIDKALRESATVLVDEDYRSREAVCRWLRNNGLSVSEDCGQWTPPASATRLPMRGVVVPAGVAPGGGARDEAVMCTESATPGS